VTRYAPSALALVLGGLAIGSASACSVVTGLDRLVKNEDQCVEPCDGGTDATFDAIRPADSHRETAPPEAAAVDAGHNSIDASPDSPADRSSPDAGDADADAALGDAPIGDAPGGESGDARADASMCKNDLSNVGTADFHISFTLRTKQTGQAAVVNQRPACGFAMFWDITLDDQGRVLAETDDYSPTGGSMAYASVTSTVAVNDGRPHAIVVQRVAQVLTVKIDGAASGSTPVASNLHLLPALQEGVDACDVGSCSNCVRQPRVGSITNFCATSP
jgi:hypothetical protein